MARPQATQILSLAQNIALIRQAMELSQPAFGRLHGVSENTVSRWERGMVIPTIDHLCSICEEANTHFRKQKIRDRIGLDKLVGFNPHANG